MAIPGREIALTSSIGVGKDLGERVAGGGDDDDYGGRGGGRLRLGRCRRCHWFRSRRLSCRR